MKVLICLYRCAVAITVLKDKDPGAFIVRDSHSFRGAYGLAMKVATPPPSVLHQSKKGEEMENTLQLINSYSDLSFSIFHFSKYFIIKILKVF